MTDYAIVIEKSGQGYGAWVPDLPGCIATGSTEREVRTRIAEAIRLHLEGLREDGHAVPSPTTRVGYADGTAVAESQESYPKTTSGK